MNLEELYTTYNKREYVHPDPLEFLYNYPKLEDREVVGLIASSLAYGRVYQILKSVSFVLNKMGDSPFDFIKNTDDEYLNHIFCDFKYRFTKGEHIVSLLISIKEIILDYSSLYDCFVYGINKNDDTIINALKFFSEKLLERNAPKHLIPTPAKGSACKRLNLFLRWMVRFDAVDPGGWDNRLTPKLIVPLDVHMHKISIKLGLTSRKQADMRTAKEITEAFRHFSPSDPVKYDFALTRLGIRKDINVEPSLPLIFSPKTYIL
ncbi:MAG: TIGR02757 family protein [Desulfobacterales bacterium]|nr:TIGR02757 family protein [Desulfobacterales bacterium]MBF0398197.1 TIGR02757 family protein [Desulfobacterales bacterium]